MSPDAAHGSLAPMHSGKIRDLYALPADQLLMVASDRISAFDFVLDTPIPDKGRILTQMSLWWFEQLAEVAPNHVVTADLSTVELPDGLPDGLAGRSVVCERLDMVGVECVARGYLTGSGFASYQQDGTVSGIGLPTGLADGSRLQGPIFTPTTKAAVGDHDEPMTYGQVVDQVGSDLGEQLRRITLEIYRRGEEIARERGVILADTKVEFGRRRDGTLVLADELLTPDSSRYWPAVQWEPGRAQPSFDKQYVRDWLTSPAAGWDRTSGEHPPPLPDDVVSRTRAKYVEAYERLTGLSFD